MLIIMFFFVLKKSKLFVIHFIKSFLYNPTLFLTVGLKKKINAKKTNIFVAIDFFLLIFLWFAH